MKIFGKLVRDKIPEIITKNGETPIVRTLEKDEYKKELTKKLQEEVTEYLESYDVLELADIEEVLRALVELSGVSYEDFDKMRKEKVEKRGAFKNRVFLESTK